MQITGNNAFASPLCPDLHVTLNENILLTELSQSLSISVVTWVCAKAIGEKFSFAWFWFTNIPLITKFGSLQNFITQNVIVIYLDNFFFYKKHFLDQTLIKEDCKQKIFQKK